MTAGSGLGVAGYNMGVAVADVNNDGRPDVLLTQYGGLRLFLNRGGGRFEDVTAEAGLRSQLWGTSAAFVDYDRDGWLDLVVVNYLDYDPTKETCVAPDGHKDFCGPGTMPGTCSKLFRNRGPVAAAAGKPAARVRFEDVSFASGIGRLPGPGLGVVCADFDGDGWPDIFVANDGQPNRLWVNRHDGTFADEAVSRGLAYTAMGQAFAGMGIALGDVDNDGLLDVYVTHLTAETNTLWKQGPRGQFRDWTRPAGLASTRWRGTGFGTLLADFDLDGAVDIAVVNGRVLRGGPAPDTGLGFWQTYAERNQLFANDGAGQFRDLSPANPAFCGRWNVARGLAGEDFDGDGAPDLLVTTIGGRARLFRNVAPDRGHWLKVRVLDLRLAEVYLERQELAEAEKLFQEEWRRQPDDPRAALGLGMIARACDDGPTAEAFLNKAQSSPLARKRAMVQRAALARARGDTAAAADYDRATAAWPEDPPWPDPFLEQTNQLRVGHYAWLQQESQLEDQHRFAEAAALYLQEARTEPTARAYARAGFNLAQAGDYEQAVTYLQEVVRLDPNSAHAHFLFAVTLFVRAETAWKRSANSPQAREWFRASAEQARRATALRPTQAAAYLFWGRALRYLGEPAAAAAPLRQGVECAPENFSLQLALGEVLLEMGQYPEAETHLKNAQQLHPKDPRPDQALGRLRRAAPYRRRQRSRRRQVKAKRQRRGRKCRPLPRAKAGADHGYKEFKIVTLYDDAQEHRLVSVTRGDGSEGCCGSGHANCLNCGRCPQPGTSQRTASSRRPS